jgi:hypothetical protein
MSAINPYEPSRPLRRRGDTQIPRHTLGVNSADECESSNPYFSPTRGTTSHHSNGSRRPSELPSSTGPLTPAQSSREPSDARRSLRSFQSGGAVGSRSPLNLPTSTPAHAGGGTSSRIPSNTDPPVGPSHIVGRTSSIPSSGLLRPVQIGSDTNSRASSRLLRPAQGGGGPNSSSRPACIFWSTDKYVGERRSAQQPVPGPAPVRPCSSIPIPNHAPANRGPQPHPSRNP